jgi:hypothetical protein
MRTLCFVVSALVLLACGGSPPPPAEPATPAAVVAPEPPKPEPPPAPPPKPADAEGAARAFAEALGKHDADGVVRASSDDFGRGQARKYADITEARFEGPAPSEAWPHILELDKDASLFWVTLVGKEGPDKVVLVVSKDKTKSSFAVVGLRTTADREEIAAKEKASARPTKLEAQGKLLTKPAKSAVKVTVESAAPPSVGDKAELMRRVDPSVPLFGGSWLVIADTEVTAVDGKTVTLKILAEKSDVKVNGKKVDHYTIGVPIRLSWSK